MACCVLFAALIAVGLGLKAKFLGRAGGVDKNVLRWRLEKYDDGQAS